MAKAADQFRASDFAFWGIAAIASCGLAVFTASISAVLPQGLLGGLHASRLEGGDANQLRAEVASLQADAAELRRLNEALLLRFNMAEDTAGDVVQRVGALEVSIPDLLEQLREREAAAHTPVDASAVTFGIGAVETFEADGGTVSVRRVPMEPLPVPPALDQDMPLVLAAPAVTAAAEPGLYGIAIGPAVALADAGGDWERLNAKLGPLLLGLEPLLGEDADPGLRRIVAGPVDDLPSAEALCRRMGLVGIQCLPVPYEGAPLAD